MMTYQEIKQEHYGKTLGEIADMEKKENKKSILVWVDEENHKKMKIWGVNNNKTLREFVGEAIKEKMEKLGL